MTSERASPGKNISACVFVFFLSFFNRHNSSVYIARCSQLMQKKSLARHHGGDSNLPLEMVRGGERRMTPPYFHAVIFIMSGKQEETTANVSSLWQKTEDKQKQPQLHKPKWFDVEQFFSYILKIVSNRVERVFVCVVERIRQSTSLLLSVKVKLERKKEAHFCDISLNKERQTFEMRAHFQKSFFVSLFSLSKCGLF